MSGIPAIPTTYNGVAFRSRLEARWAAMFDVLGWTWEYEPLDLHGTVPDFVLTFPVPMLVEVKPLVVLDLGWCADHIAKIDSCGWKGEVLLLGATMHETPDDINVGFMRNAEIQNSGWVGNLWRPAQITWCADHWSPHAIGGTWGCRTGACAKVSQHPYYPRRSREKFHVGMHFDDRTRLIGAWRAAGNRVQWRPNA